MAQRDRGTGRSGHGSSRGSARDQRPAGDGARRATGGPRSGDFAAYKARLTEVIEPVAHSAGYDLEELSVVRMGRRHVVRVTVDRDGGVGLDAVADLSRDISHGLDAAEASGGEFIAGEYELEVSSPGTDRPLTEPRHWRRNVGRLVHVKIDGHRVTGRVVGADDSTMTLDVDGEESAHAYGDLGPGRIEVEFSRPSDVDIDGSDLDDVDVDDDEFDDDDFDDDDFDGDEFADDIEASGDDERADVGRMDDDDIEDMRARTTRGEEDVR